MPIELVIPSSHLILCRPLLLLPPVPPSIRVFSSESTLPMRNPYINMYPFSPKLEWNRLGFQEEGSKEYCQIQFNSFSCSVVSDSLRPHESQHARPPCPSTNSRSPPKPMSIELVMPSNHLILCCPLLLLPSIFPSIFVHSSFTLRASEW